MSTDNTPATKTDVEEVVERVVTRVVVNAKTEILSAVGDQLSAMNEDIDKQFNNVANRLDDVEATVTRIENKLDTTADKVDDHEVRVKKLEHKVA